MLTQEQKNVILALIRQNPRRLADFLERESEQFREVCMELREYAEEREELQ